MPTARKPVSRALRHRLSFWEQLDLEYGPDERRPCFRADEAERRAVWSRHRDWLMAQCRHGFRPDAWWAFEAPITRPSDDDYERAALWEAGLLSDEERAEFEAEWREEFEYTLAPDFMLCIGPGKWLKGITARRAALRSAGIPRALIKRWSAARRRRTETIRKLAEPEPI
jgi:hypothetical protein